jgi:hypothetical protein
MSEHDELRAATVRALGAVEELRSRVGTDSGVLFILGERIAALLDEFAWEIGVVDSREEG